MMVRANRTYTWMLLMFVLSLGAAAGRAATAAAERNDAMDPNTLFSRIMNAGTEKTADTEGAFSNEITRRLWRSRVSAPGQASDAQTQAALSDLVHRVRSIRFEAKPQGPAAAPFILPEPVVREPNAAPDPAKAEPRPAQAAAAASAALGEALPAGTVEALKRVLADPNQASEPLELAELLYLTGRLSEAAVLYQKALDSLTANDPATREDRAWTLLQLGNCLRETNPGRARDLYTKLVAEHPDSPWVELAKAHSQLISWYEQLQPRQWLAGQDMPPTRQVAASQKPQP
jgi:tetratricopeptide (TPR) repeat protein